MYKHLLIPTDGSELSGAAVRDGMRLASAIGAKVTVLTVTPPFHAATLDAAMLTSIPEQYEEDCKAAAERYLRLAKEAAVTADVRGDYRHVVNDRPYEAIIDTAVRSGCDLIFMASHGRRGVASLLLGSETTKVLTHSKIPVLVCR
jgi:nucleotide-binding universal stress UspA family protein